MEPGNYIPDLSEGVYQWVEELDYEYMILHVIVCYGLYYSKNMQWINQYFSPVKKKGRSRSVWFVGALLALIEMIKYLPFIGEGTLSYQKMIAIFHSYVVIQVFVDPIVTQFHKWLSLIRNDDSMSL